MTRQLFSELALRGLKLRNRIFMSPMVQYSAEAGCATSWHLVHYGARAVGGAGLIILEATSVSNEGRISGGDLELHNQRQAASLAPLAGFIRQNGAAAGIQLAHAGRKAGKRPPWVRIDQGEPPLWPTVAPSPQPFSSVDTPPHALTNAEIEEIVIQFQNSAQLALQAGFQVVEIHMAHGYLLHQFLSPLTNLRTDEFGGSLENRLRLPLQVTRAVRAVWPDDLPLFVRISATDWTAGGWDLEQSLVLAAALQGEGVDLIDCSSGGLLPAAEIPVEPGYQVPFASSIREQVSIPTAAVGLITEPAQADAIINSGQADAVCLGRQLLREPYWPLRAAHQLGVNLDWPQPYRAGKWR
ncbi:MAG: NADH:flavin oxidoreductase/NADH oxidase [Candidatus Delongbacteria bacterium]|nr:NADH:flavin oxidoreductase/NADH oxidase [Candidatus Delongbacteria bacterium]